MRHVFVNGQAVLREGVATGARPGRFVRGPGFAGAGADTRKSVALDDLPQAAG
jgi:hypothetical protein